MTTRIAAALLVALLGLVACDDDGASVRDLGGTASGGSGSGSGSGTGHASGSGTGHAADEADCEPDDTEGTLEVRLDEFSVTPHEDEITSGPTKLLAVNAGKLTHELVVLAARSVESLPLDPKGAVDEEALRPGQLIAEIHGIEPGAACVLEVDLEPGTYVLLCNIRAKADGKMRKHFLQGMRARIKVS